MTLLPRTEPTAGAQAVRYSVVIPVYGNEGSVEALLRRLEGLVPELDGPMEAVFVVDGSPDGSLDRLRELLPTAALATQLISHSRNFGSFAAIRTGIHAARGEYIGVMAADLQEPPELMLEFFRVLSTDEADITVGRREGRNDPALSSFLSRAFWGLYRRTINPAIPRGGVDVFALNRRAASELISLPESHSSLVGLLYWIGFRRVEVPYVRAPREVGRTGWTMKKKIRYLLDSVYSFTDLPISILTTVGVVGSVVTLLVSIVVFFAWLNGSITSPGYTPLMLALLFSTFVVLYGLGIVGSYVWRIYENSKQRPFAISTSVEHHDVRGD